MSTKRSINQQRFLIASLLHPDEEITFLTVSKLVPDIYQVKEAELARGPSPRILKSHEAFTPRYPKVIYVTRDPRSVAVSMYHFLIGTRKFGPEQPMEDFIRSYLRGEHFHNFRPWGENVSSWVSQVDAGNKNILVLRYEDMKKNTVEELRRVAAFLERPASEAALRAAVEKCTFERMQKLEAERKLINPSKKWDASRQFVRKGALDEWQQLFTPEQNETICRAFAEPMRRMNYL